MICIIKPLPVEATYRSSFFASSSSISFTIRYSALSVVPSKDHEGTPGFHYGQSAHGQSDPSQPPVGRPLEVAKLGAIGWQVESHFRNRTSGKSKQ